MSRFFKTFVALALIMVMVAAFAPRSVNAQDGGGLSDEQKALLDRVLAASDTVDGLSSYVSENISSNVINLAISVMGFDITIAESTDVASTTTYIAGEDGDNLSLIATINSASSNEVPGQESETSYTLDANVLHVDGVTYGSAVYRQSEGDELPVLPEGWVTLSSKDDFEGIFADLELDKFFAELEEETPNPLEDREFLESALEDISSEVITLEDGTEAELITLTFSASGFLEYLNKQLEEQGNSTAQQIFSAIDTDNAEMYAAVILGADDLPIANQVFLNLALEGSEFDLGAMDPSMPAGTMASLDLVLSMSQSTVLSDHNSTELVPAVAPEAVAE